MSKKTIAILFILSIVMGLAGALLIGLGFAGSTYAQVSNGYSTSYQLQSMGNPGLFASGVALAALAGIPHLIAWIGTLVNLGRLGHWVWFILTLLFSTIMILIYLIAGPTTPAQAPQFVPRSDAPPQPPSQGQ